MLGQFDYKLLQALAAVVKEQSFERAAAAIYITQSAISQRIKQLEQVVSQPVLIRSSPPRATEIGKKLISHYYQVEQLEQALSTDIFPSADQQALAVHLATNADSLATWLIPALADVLTTNRIALDLSVADEMHTIEKLKGGEVFGAISMEERAIKGCQSSYLGDLRYALVCAPVFKERYFRDGVDPDSLAQAPAVAFDQRDDMHSQFIFEHFGLSRGEYPLHTVPSSDAFVRLAKNGVAYCLVADMQIKQELENGSLVDLMPEFRLIRNLYWQRWQLLKGAHLAISEAILQNSQRFLSPRSLARES